MAHLGRAPRLAPESLRAGRAHNERQKREAPRPAYHVAVTILEVVREASALGRELVRQAALPAKADADALHIAIATVHGLDYLLTWNCTHIANATMRPRIEAICRA